MNDTLRCKKYWTLSAAVLVALFAVAEPPSAETASASPTLTLVSPRTSKNVAALPAVNGCTVDPARELFIRDVSVVDDCYRTTWTGVCSQPALPATRGAWTFGKLMEGVAGTTDPAKLSTFVLNWLLHWKKDIRINGDLVPGRPNVQTKIIDPWVIASGGGQLDMKKAPFRLLAIVARLDLRQNAGYEGGTSAGEGRFVFNLLDENGNPTQFLTILEYHLNAESCTDVMSWAGAWHGLGSIPFGPTYSAALQSVTDQFTAIGAAPTEPNGSALSQLRTNDFFLLAPPWELREFRLGQPTVAGVPGPLTQVPVAQTVANGHQRRPIIANYINSNTAALLAGNHVVPKTFAGSNFKGGASSHMIDFDWDGPQPPPCGAISTPDARHVFSRETCNGCHGAETQTFFKHVEPRLPGAASNLSAFLTGSGPLVDLCGWIHTFNDIERRRVDLCQVLVKTCDELDAEPPISFVH